MVSILDAIGSRHGTDKANRGHDYLRWYELYLAPWRDREFTLLEIGVGDGPSLRLWRDYFQRARVVGMDIEPSKSHHAGDRIEIMIGDQSKGEDLDRIAGYGPFGVIVDDAGHQAEVQVASHERLLRHLVPGGLYILEDIGGQPTIQYLNDLASQVMQGQGPAEAMGFYKGTSVTVMPGGRSGDYPAANEKAADTFAEMARQHFKRHLDDVNRLDGR